MIGYRTVSELGIQMMPFSRPGTRRWTTPADNNARSPVLYHRKSHGYSGMMAAFIKVPT